MIKKRIGTLGSCGLAVFITAITLVTIIVIAGIAYLSCPKPDLVTFTTYSKAFTDRHGALLRLTLAEDDRYRLHQPFTDIADNIKLATLLYEDKNYYQHGGVDLFAIARAFWTTYITQQRRVGASTITMQVARLRWQLPSNTLSGKLQQILRAVQLSRHYAKDAIFAAYLNLAPYGGNIEGIGAASLIYFNKPASELNLPEALTLAVIPQNPNKRTPTTAEGFTHLLTARQPLFAKWIKAYPEDAQQQKFMQLPLNVRSTKELPFIAPHFTTYLQHKMSRWDSGYINTSLDRVKQQHIEKIITDYRQSKSRIGIKNASALVLNYKTMQIESMVGSVAFNDKSISGQVNGVLAKRSPGSTLKPFVYALALDEGLIHPMTLLKDAPKRFGGFTPENHDKQFLGPILAGDALIESRNVPAVDLQAQLKQKSFYAFLQSAGISGLKEASFYGLALALGGGEVSMLELTKLYAMLANRGILQEPSGLQFLSNNHVPNNNVPNNNTHTPQLISPEASYIILHILKDNPAPDSIDFDSNDPLKNDVVWKTGTSWAFRDAWAIGITGDYVIAVWVGNFDGSGNEAFIGRSAAGPLMFSIADAIVPRQGWTVEKNMYTTSLNIKQVQTCKNTGDLPGKYCPSTEAAWFIPGVSPIKVSNIYRSIPILKATGQRACWFDPDKTDMKIYTFWPSDFLHIFRQAGISLNTPPAYAKECSLNQKSASGQTPIIISPQSSVQYALQSKNPAANQIPFSATVDPDVKKLFWFVDNRFIGVNTTYKPLLWQATPGDHIARVVDDAGRSARLRFSVFTLQ